MNSGSRRKGRRRVVVAVQVFFGKCVDIQVECKTAACDYRVLGKGKGQCLPHCRLSPNLVTYHHEVASIQLSEVCRGKLFDFIIGVETDELHLFTKSSETGLN